MLCTTEVPGTSGGSSFPGRTGSVCRGADRTRQAAMGATAIWAGRGSRRLNDEREVLVCLLLTARTGEKLELSGRLFPGGHGSRCAVCTGPVCTPCEYPGCGGRGAGGSRALSAGDPDRGSDSESEARP
jgi:hypothetical protein